ncbi:hypothetical protein TNCV_4170151 [Trichonephila clavipes]|nr:hypothetical protein TNCV_4170151 [Trichonephila clavipes]
MTSTIPDLAPLSISPPHATGRLSLDRFSVLQLLYTMDLQWHQDLSPRHAGGCSVEANISEIGALVLE